MTSLDVCGTIETSWYQQLKAIGTKGMKGTMERKEGRRNANFMKGKIKATGDCLVPKMLQIPCT